MDGFDSIITNYFSNTVGSRFVITFPLTRIVPFDVFLSFHPFGCLHDDDDDVVLEWQEKYNTYNMYIHKRDLKNVDGRKSGFNNSGLAKTRAS